MGSVHQCTWERNRLGITTFCCFLDTWTARIWQAHKPCTLIKCLTSCVIPCPPKQAVNAVALNIEQVCMPARNHKRRRGKLHFRVCDEVGIQMCLDMVNRDNRNPEGLSEGFSGCHSDEQSTEKAGAVCDTNRSDVLKREVCFRQRLPDNRNQQLNVAPRCKLGHNAAIASMLIHLTGDDGAQQLAAILHNRTRCLITARLNPEDYHGITRILLMAELLVSSPDAIDQRRTVYSPLGKSAGSCAVIVQVLDAPGSRRSAASAMVNIIPLDQ